MGCSEGLVEPGVQVGGSIRYHCRIRGYPQRVEEGVCRRERNWEVRADIDEKGVIVGQELGREETWRGGCKWVGSAMTSSLKHPGPYEGHRLVEG